jgi:hypothetical protein
VESHHHVHVFQEIAAPRAGNADVVGCTERASQPGRICRNVIDVDETPIKITIADTVITARLADNATAPTSPLTFDLQRLQPRREGCDSSSAAVVRIGRVDTTMELIATNTTTPGHDRTQLITRGGRDDRRIVQRDAAAISS